MKNEKGLWAVLSSLSSLRFCFPSLCAFVSVPSTSKHFPTLDSTVARLLCADVRDYLEQPASILSPHTLTSPAGTALSCTWGPCLRCTLRSTAAPWRMEPSGIVAMFGSGILEALRLSKSLKYICSQFSDHKARIWVQGVYLGSDPRKHCEGAGK